MTIASFAGRNRPIWIGYFALAIAVFGVPLILDRYFVGIATQILVFGLWAISLNVLVGTSGLDSIGHAAILGISAYVTTFTQISTGLSYFTAGAVAVIVTMLVSLVFSLMTTRANGLAFMMITLAQGMMVWGIAHTWVSVTDGDNGLRGGGPTGTLKDGNYFYWFTALVVLASLVLLRWFLASRYGLRLKGVRDSSERMASLGYNVRTQRLIAFNLASLPAAAGH